MIGRYGGEEFVVILSSADAAAAQPIAERIRQRVAEISVPGFGAPIHLTCSIGIATSDMLGVWGEHLIARADEAVYAAKRCGRNCVQIAAPTPGRLPSGLRRLRHHHRRLRKIHRLRSPTSCRAASPTMRSAKSGCCRSRG